MKWIYIMESGCNSNLGNCCSDPGLAVILSLCQTILSVMQLIAPIILIIFATINFITLMTNPDDKKGMKNLLNKFVAAIMVVLIPYIVNLSINILSVATNETFSIAECWEAASEMKDTIDKTVYQVIDLSDAEKKKVVTTTSSTTSSSSGSALGQEIVDDALSFVTAKSGLQYVWGGTSLTTGVDCSGFVQAIYARHGISLPRVSYDQGQAGVAVDGIENALPGDLIEYPGHIAIYIGNGQIVHAMGKAYDIVVSNVNYSSKNIKNIRRVI